MNEEQLNKLLSALAPLADFGKRLEAIEARLPAAPTDISEPAEKPEEKPAPVEDKLTAALAKIDRLAAALAAGAVSREVSEEVATPKTKGEQKFTAQQIKLAKENDWNLEELFADD